MEAKLAQRSNLRLQARALAAWTERRERQAAVQAALRAVVRRMSFLKLYHAFAGERSHGWAGYAICITAYACAAQGYPSS